MKRIARTTLRRTMSVANAFVVPMTHRDDVEALLGKVRPFSTDAPLVRLGPGGDGGYLIPDDFESIEACFSPGVGSVSGFEKDCADRGIPVFLADGSLDRPVPDHELFSFTQTFVGATSTEGFMTLDAWVDSALPDSSSDLLLQIDIEGHEYEVFLAVSERLIRRFRIIVVEFHGLDQLWNRPFFDLASRAFDKIVQSHTCVHIHPNNCGGSTDMAGVHIPHVLEFTFLRNDRVANPVPQTVFPHPLDHDNGEARSLPLPRCWYEAT